MTVDKRWRKRRKLGRTSSMNVKMNSMSSYFFQKEKTTTNKTARHIGFTLSILCVYSATTM